ncbi:MAG: response regulator [Steroidobacteraceae bacterium]
MTKQPFHICIVDDDGAVRASLESYLRSAGLGVNSFDSAEGFLNSEWRRLTDCLITDLNMPGLGGLGLQRELNRLGRDFPVIVMTAYPTMSARAESASMGVAAFLEKPIDPDLLLDRVESMLR